MARRKTAVDSFIDAYLRLTPEDRPFAMAAIKGAERALGVRKADQDEEEAAEDLGENVAQATLPGAKA